MTRRVLLEVAVSTPDDAVAAVRAGADRLELSAALEVGGVTPSPGVFSAVRTAVSVPVWVLLRPRPGGFCYSAGEFEAIEADADYFLANGADGIVCGVLGDRGQIDASRCGRLADRAKGRAVFHRAFDFLRDPLTALEELRNLGFVRVLTSGGAPTAPEGAGRLAALVRAGGIEILPGGGVRPENVGELLRRTGCDQVHGSFRSARNDGSLDGNPRLAPHLGRRHATDPDLVRRVRVAIDHLE